MSTKTTFKRIALVAVASLGLGVLTSVAPATAATAATPFVAGTASIGTPVGDGTATMKMFQLAGTGNYASLKVAAATTATTLPNYDYVTVSGSTFAAEAGASFTIDAATTTAAIAAGGTVVNDELWVATPTAGSITVKYIKRTYVAGVATDTTSQTITIVVGSAAVDAVNSTVSLNSGVTTQATPIVDDVVIAPKGSTTVIANIELTMVNLLGAPYTGTDFSASVAGPGLVANDNDGTPSTVGTSKVAALTFSAGKTWITVTGDGLAGTSTISISVGGTVWKTKTIVFSGTATKYVVDSTNPTTVVSALGVGNTQSWDLSTADAAGNAVTAIPTIYAVSSDTSILTVDTTTVAGTVTVTGVKAGTATFTVCDTAACVSPTLTLGPVSVTVTNTKADSATFSLDKSDYIAGEAFTLTITAKDAAGVLADGTYANMASLTPSVLVYKADGSVLTGAQSPVFTAGKATVKAFMPQSTGPVVFTLTLGAKGTAGVADAAAGAVLTASANITSAAVDTAQAATDAAAEATDAANAATDAANAAAEAADAATAAAQDAADAVAALSAQVATMMAQLKAQLTALTNLVIKIQRKVKA